jgi:hypothetical protein
MVSFAVEFEPPVTLEGVRLKLAGTTPCTVSVAVTFTPLSVALMTGRAVADVGVV